MGEKSDGRKLVDMLPRESDHFLDLTHVIVQGDFFYTLF